MKKEETPAMETAQEVPAQEAPATYSQTLTCPHCGKEIIIERPAAQRRGMLAGLSIEEMDDEQLKREIINSKSVLYKAQQRKTAPETIAKNQARVDACVAEKAKRDAAKAAAAPAPATEAPTEQTV